MFLLFHLIRRNCSFTVLRTSGKTESDWPRGRPDGTAIPGPENGEGSGGPDRNSDGGRHL